MILVSPRFLHIFTRGFARAMALYPFILVESVQLLKDPILLNHERIHIRQQLELAIVFFYLWYVTEFFIHYSRFRNFKKAYMAISFEREAFARDGEMDYLQHRRFWAFIRWLH